MIKKKHPRYIVDYDTKWTHLYLEPEDSLFFQAKTPVQEIVPQLEEHLNRSQSDFDMEEIDYSSRSTLNSFNSLYRNISNSCKGWQVLYRKPGSKTDYHSISEKIGHQPDSRKTTGLKSTLARTMVWKHDLDPLIKPVQLKSAANCAVIAKRLNQQFSKVLIHPVLETWVPSLTSLNQNYENLVQQKLSLAALSESSNWQTLLKNVSELSHLVKQLNVSNSKDYTIYTVNINDVLTQKYKKAKGWQVEFLD